MNHSTDRTPVSIKARRATLALPRVVLQVETNKQEIEVVADAEAIVTFGHISQTYDPRGSSNWHCGWLCENGGHHCTLAGAATAISRREIPM